ncbi:hypothetical protein B0H03_10124 [Rathayibacter iranicus NCPPB 2253 = VKM Ac-1602]|uniref:Uncharacterized protein n=1 Tax=Rathayibacter iranicus NCPPB 2253 = VKM Ac-1602 TaxID=1328868 RepID=A0ABX5LHB3_9MICO|nr:hypothetical protein B0H03_10124 [Rathayibacter iranicus NCPPB 2253 = VKM Ac-1602]
MIAAPLPSLESPKVVALGAKCDNFWTLAGGTTVDVE